MVAAIRSDIFVGYTDSGMHTLLGDKFQKWTNLKVIERKELKLVSPKMNLKFRTVVPLVI